ncbi:MULTISPECIES: alpha-amylase family glycosyl hydrolase [unclassified Carboxylicivirga]|uniref:alpha-amylase family glycosyl hydrolase n=1 Tax=Carboxylicivirga TaxID=1628153 RepID=UPI003D32A87C
MIKQYITEIRKGTYVVVALLLLAVGAKAQVVISDPALPTESDKVTITFYADRGTGGLAGFTGDVYAHTGVITDKSSGSSDWQYAPTWGDNSAKYKMTRTATDVYTLEITPDVRQYYGVADGEVIQQMAFVFRSADTSLEGKDTGGKDIFVDVSDAVLSVAISSPVNNRIYEAGASVDIRVDALLNDQIELWVNDEVVAQSDASSLTHTLSNVTAGTYNLLAVASRGAESVEALSKFFVRGDVVNEPMPAGLRRGVNVLSATSATVVLFAPNKEYVYLVGDFNNWEPSAAAMMKKDGDYFWLTLDGLDNKDEYAYQFWVDGQIKIADPYANKILDPWNDRYIPERIYPNLKPYPQGQDEIVSVFTTADQTFSWEVNNFVAPSPEKLVVYELLIRDFTDAQDIKTVTDTLAYLKRLGVNAIELMPFNEFEGNDSWGYNPSFYFATDKAYGTTEDYKIFIDECHKAGIAVIMDMVLNHSYGQSPFARMYLGNDGQPLNNPWYNAKSNIDNPGLSWGYDFNHESEHTQALVDSICSFWMREFKVDGFRFDFTKGFSNTEYPMDGDEWANGPDADRIRLLKRMADEIWQRKSDALVIFEHLAANAEEKELADHGILLWGNANHNYNEATMGYTENAKSDLSWTNYQRRQWSKPVLVNYMESHDEERIMYKNQLFGNVVGDHNVKETATALQRTEGAAVLLMATPGPVMIWQFGELGFDLSINRCTDGTVSNDCRLAPKPPKWDYQGDPDRTRLFEVYRRMIEIKKNEPVFATDDFTMDVRGAVKRISLNMEGSDVRIVANFGMEPTLVTPDFSTAGKWYDILGKDSLVVSDPAMEVRLLPGDYMLYSQKKLSGFEQSTSSGGELVQKAVMVAPNPFTDEVSISHVGEGASFALYSLSGALIDRGTLAAGNSTHNWSQLPQGNYLLRIQHRNGLEVMKLIKR